MVASCHALNVTQPPYVPITVDFILHLSSVLCGIWSHGSLSTFNICVPVVFAAGRQNRARLRADTPRYLLSGPVYKEIIIMLVSTILIIFGFQTFLWLKKDGLNSHQGHFSDKFLVSQTFSLLGNDHLIIYA